MNEPHIEWQYATVADGHTVVNTWNPQKLIENFRDKELHDHYDEHHCPGGMAHCDVAMKMVEKMPWFWYGVVG